MPYDIKDRIFTTLNNVEELVWCMNVDNLELVYANKHFYNVFDVTANQLNDANYVFVNAIHKEDQALFINAVKEGVEKGISNCNFRFFTNTGILKSVSAELVYNRNEGEAQGIIVAIGHIQNADPKTGMQQGELRSENLSILDNIRDAFFILDNDGGIIFANKAFAKFIKFEGDDLSGKNIWDVFPDAKGLLFEEAFKWSVNQQINIEIEEYLPSIGRWLSVFTYPSENGISVFIHDITKMKRNNELLMESEKKFHLMSDNSPMFIMTMDEQLLPTFYNKTFLNFSGLDLDQLLETGWASIVADDEKEKISEIWNNGLATRTEINFECRMKRHDDAYRWIKMNATPQVDISGVFRGFLVNGVDITELKYYYETLEDKNKELELALNESRRLSGILNKTSNILVLTDVEGKITWVNEAFTKYKEYTLEEVIGKKPGPLVYGPETNIETINILHEGIRKGEITRVEILNYSKSGNKIWVDLRIEPIYKNGVPEGYMAIEMDITKRKKDEIAIKERNEKIKEFSFITSHDLRHEFAKVMMLLNLAKSKENTIEDYKTLFNHLEIPVNKINAIIAKINTNLYLGDVNVTLEEKLSEMDEIREICLVDDDELTNMIHKQIIKIILPQTPIRIYDTVDNALAYLQLQPNSNRVVFLDLVFHNDKSGWDFLEEYERLGLAAPVIILSSSIDNADLEKSKKYKCVLEYFVKPLTAETLHKYIKK